jgi:hypothetical protein
MDEMHGISTPKASLSTRNRGWSLVAVAALALTMAGCTSDRDDGTSGSFGVPEGDGTDTGDTGDDSGTEETDGDGEGDGDGGSSDDGEGDGGSGDDGEGDGATPSDCGNGILEGTEECDQNDFGFRDCLTYGFMAGTLVCNADCTVNTDNCLSETVCGDEVIGGLEDCEGDDVQGETCDSLGLGTGELVCNASDCTFDAADCSCKGQGEACYRDPITAESDCCPPGYKGNTYGACGAGSGTCS